ncbi:MAG: preprotein translocase subunit SecG [Candidatus Omnitrophica bacterium]|nr:preprotein translocase subunit SecG [Candidatus Omnitrophota bacterium]
MIFLVVLHVIVSLVLILVILLQAGKGGGLSESFGGASQQLFGTKSSTFLNRATAICAILFLLTCLSLGILSSHGRRSLMENAPPGQAASEGKREDSTAPVAFPSEKGETPTTGTPEEKSEKTP